MDCAAVVRAWDEAPATAIHPARERSEAAYWASGRDQAEAIAARLNPGARVLDFGCGDGRVSRPLADQGFAVTGMDASPRMLERLEHPGVVPILGDGLSLPPEMVASFDLVAALAVLIHHDWVTGIRMIINLSRAVRSGGLVILDVPLVDTPAERRHWIDITTWTRGDFDAVAASLELEPVEPIAGFNTYRKVPTHA